MPFEALVAIGVDAKVAVPKLNGLLNKVWERDKVWEGDSFLPNRLLKALDKLGAPPLNRLLKDFLPHGGPAKRPGSTRAEGEVGCPWAPVGTGVVGGFRSGSVRRRCPGPDRSGRAATRSQS